MSEPVRWGILGPGRITERFIAGARLTGAAVVTAVGSREQSRADAYALQHGIAHAHAHGSYEAFLNDPQIEVVYIALPNGSHHPWTMAALRSGKHVLCEKPYSRYPAEVDEAYDLAEASGLILSEAFMWRHHPQVSQLREILPALGTLETVRATFSFIPDDPQDIRLQASLEGGSLMDVGCYCVNGARFVAGEEPNMAIGTSTIGAGGVDVKFSGILRFPSGLIAEISSSFVTNGRMLEVVGSKGTVQLLDPWNAMPAVIVQGGVSTTLGHDDSYRLEIEDMSAAIRGRSRPLLGRADAKGQARAIEALYRSAATGSAVDL
jgi:D-xylose 1-dehydrogenase (NADP+, D-xylono-1,5-lactone-forming)